VESSAEAAVKTVAEAAMKIVSEVAAETTAKSRTGMTKTSTRTRESGTAWREGGMSGRTAAPAPHLSAQGQCQDSCDQPGNEHVPHKSIIAPFHFTRSYSV